MRLKSEKYQNQLIKFKDMNGLIFYKTEFGHNGFGSTKQEAFDRAKQKIDAESEYEGLANRTNID